MGSIQEMPSTGMVLESRVVEKREGRVGPPLNATESRSKAEQTNGISDQKSHHVSNGHLTPDSKRGDGASTSPEREQRGDQPLPSVEKDEDCSPSTAPAEHEREKTLDGERRAAVYSSQAQTRHQNSSSVPVSFQTPADSIKLEKEIARLNQVLAETSARAAQKVLHDKWRFFLFDQYDESHISFILRAGFKNANPTVTEKVLQDKSFFKERVLDIASRKPAVIEKVVTNVTAAQLLHDCPQRVLDEALAERLKTVSAKQLISWLARADRLGYKMDDIIDEDDESVIPRAESDAEMAEVFEVEPAPRFVSSYRDPLLTEQEKNLEAQHIEKLKADAARQLHEQQQHQRLPPQPSNKLSCPDCGVVFPTTSGYTYHTTKKPCKRIPPVLSSKWWCDNCIQGFTTKQGMDYHKLKGVCIAEDIAPATSPSNQLRREAASHAQHRPSPAQLPSQSQVQSHIPPIPRPSFPNQPPQSESTPATSYGPSPHQEPSQSQEQSRTQVMIQRPPLHTPAPASTHSVSTPGPRKQAPPSDVRQSPSELSAERLAALNRELQEADDRYQQQIDEIPLTYTEQERTARLVSLKNGNASRKSQIRKAHGVSLRLREKDKLARMAGGVSQAAKAASEHRPMTSITSQATPTSTPPVSSFSPINTPPRTEPNSSNYGRPSNPLHPSHASRYNGPHSGDPPHPSQASRYNTPPVSSNAELTSRPSYSAATNAAQLSSASSPSSSYRPPPLNASVRVQSPYMAHDPNTLSHALDPPGPKPSGFGVLRVQDLASNPAPPANNPNKRRRSPEDEGRPVSRRTSAGPSASSNYVAPNLFDQKQLARQGQVQPQVVIGGHAADSTLKVQASEPTAKRDTPMTDATPPKTTYTQATAIEILSSESESEDLVTASRSNSLHRDARQSVQPGSHIRQSKEPEENKEVGDDDKDMENEKRGEVTESEPSDHESESAKKHKHTRSTSGTGRKGFMAKRGGKH
jgi:hypothetical protein